MAIKDTLDERLRVVKAYGTAEELAQVLDEIAREKSREERNAQRKAVGLIPTLSQLGERIDKKRAEVTPTKIKRGL